MPRKKNIIFRTTTIYIPVALHRKAKALAKKRKTSFSTLISELVAKEIISSKTEKK